MSAQPLGVCLIGPGNVGSEVLNAVRAAQAQWSLRSVVVRELRAEHRAAHLPATVDGERAVADRCVDVVIDASSSAELGFNLVYAALRAGKVAVTANKDLAVQHGNYLEALASTWGGSFGYDAAVCAALPVTALLRSHCAVDEITEIDGVFSGTCNYVLHAMASQGLTLPAAVAEAQRLGYAEPDATDDLSGVDAARKTALIARLASGPSLPLTAVTRIGIEDVTAEDHQRAAANGQVLRLVSRIRLTDELPHAWVSPLLIDRGHPLAQATGPENVLRVRAERLGTITLTGLGAGAAATAAALLSDAHALCRRTQVSPVPASSSVQ